MGSYSAFGITAARWQPIHLAPCPPPTVTQTTHRNLQLLGPAGHVHVCLAPGLAWHVSDGHASSRDYNHDGSGAICNQHENLILMHIYIYMGTTNRMKQQTRQVRIKGLPNASLSPHELHPHARHAMACMLQRSKVSYTMYRSMYPKEMSHLQDHNSALKFDCKESLPLLWLA